MQQLCEPICHCKYLSQPSSPSQGNQALICTLSGIYMVYCPFYIERQTSISVESKAGCQTRVDPVRGKKYRLRWHRFPYRYTHERCELLGHCRFSQPPHLVVYCLPAAILRHSCPKRGLHRSVLQTPWLRGRAKLSHKRSFLPTLRPPEYWACHGAANRPFVPHPRRRGAPASICSRSRMSATIQHGSLPWMINIAVER